MNAKTITIFIPDLGGGGAERVIVTLANEFIKKDFKVNLLLVRLTGPYVNEIDDRVNIIVLGASKNIFSLFPLVSYLRKYKPSVILSTLLITNIITILAVKLARLKTRVVLREAITASASVHFDQKTTEIIISKFRKWALKNADIVIAPSFGVSNDLIESCGLNPNKIRVIYNPISLEKCFHDALEYNDILNSIPLNKKIILGIGRLYGQKDFVTLINAFNRVKNNKDVILVILGEGKDREKLETLVSLNNLEEQVILPGFVSNPFPFLKRAKVFVLSSLYEGLPNSLMQALVFQKQIVATNCPSGPYEMLFGGQFGYLVNIGDVEEMALGIVKGLNGQLNELPINKVSELYNSNDVANKYLEVLFEI